MAADAIAQLLIKLGLKDEASGKLKKTSSGLGTLKKAASAAAGIAGVGGLAISIQQGIKAFAKYEQNLANVKTLLGGDEKAAQDMDKTMKGLLKTMPVDPDELGAASYAVLSAGFTDAAESAEVLENAAKLSIGGLGTMDEATTLTTVAMNAFKDENLSAEETTGILFNTVKNGITTVGDLSQSFGKVAGNAVAAGVTFADMQAATAALSAITGKTSESQNALAQVFLELTQVGGKLDKGLQDAGGSLDEMRANIEEYGLMAALNDMKEQTGLNDTEFKNLFSSAEGGTAVFQLLTAGMDTYSNTMLSNKDSAEALQQAYEDASGTLNNWWQLLKNNVTVEIVKVGDAIVNMAGIAREKIDETKQAMGELEEQGQVTSEGISEGSKIMADSFDGVKKEMEALQLQLGISEEKGSEFWETLRLGGLEFVNVLPEALMTFVQIFLAGTGEIIRVFQTAGRIIITIVQGVGVMLDNFFVKPLERAISTVIRLIGWFSKLGGAKESSGVSEGFQQGGLVYAQQGTLRRGTDSVPAMLTPGEMVINKSQQSRLFNLLSGRSGAGGGSIEVNFNNVNVRSDNDLEVIVDAVRSTLARDAELVEKGL